MRKALGEIPRVTNSVSFTDVLRTDSITGARVLKSPADLLALFERVPGLDFETPTAPSEDLNESEADFKTAVKLQNQDQSFKLQREVIFTCQIGVSACQTFIALQQAMHHHQSQMRISNLERKTLPKNYKLSVYDGSYEEYSHQTKQGNEQKKTA